MGSLQSRGDIPWIEPEQEEAFLRILCQLFVRNIRSSCNEQSRDNENRSGLDCTGFRSARCECDRCDSKEVRNVKEDGSHCQRPAAAVHRIQS